MPGASTVDAQPGLAPALAALSLPAAHELQATRAHRVARSRIGRRTVGTTDLANTLFRTGGFHFLFSFKRAGRRSGRHHRLSPVQLPSPRSPNCTFPFIFVALSMVPV